MRRLRLLALLPLAACGRDLELLGDARDGAPVPLVTAVQPPIAVASLGSPLVFWGEHLDEVDEVRIGAYTLRREDGLVKSMDGQLLVNVMASEDGAELYGSSAEDGRAAPVRLVSGGRETLTAQTVRVFSGRAEIEEIAPTVLAPGQLIFLRGRGFDPDLLQNNDLRLAPNGVECTGSGERGTGNETDPGSGETGSGGAGSSGGGEPPVDGGGRGGTGGEPPVGGGDGPAEPSAPPELGGGLDDGCIRADVFWATDGLIVAIVPDTVPGGPMQVRYWNQAFLQIDEFMASWQANGGAMEGMYAGEPPPPAESGGAGGFGADAAAGDTRGLGAPPGASDGVEAMNDVVPPTGDGGAGGEPAAWVPMASQPAYSPSAQDQIYVWQDPGRLALDPASVVASGAMIRVAGQGRLYYPASNEDPSLSVKLQVLVDGAPVDALAVFDPPEGELPARFLDVVLPESLAAGPHAVQVVNPFFESSVLWLRL